MCLFELLIEELLRREVHLFAAEVLNAEAHPTELDGIKLLDLVIELALRVFQRAYHEPQPVDGLLLSISVSMLDVEALCSQQIVAQ